jgi:hypothetical protein
MAGRTSHFSCSRLPIPSHPATSTSASLPIRVERQIKLWRVTITPCYSSNLPSIPPSRWRYSSSPRLISLFHSLRPPSSPPHTVPATYQPCDQASSASYDHVWTVWAMPSQQRLVRVVRHRAFACHCMYDTQALPSALRARCDPALSLW